MVQTSQARRIYSGCVLFFLAICPAFSAFALSNGCLAVNALSGSTSLSFSANAFPASDFQAGDILTVSFIDSGSGKGKLTSAADSIGFTTFAQSRFQTYNAANARVATPHSVTLNLTTGDLVDYGLRVRATTSFGQISGLVFNCVSQSADSSDATLSGLTLSAGTLSPSFTPANTSYSASVASSVAAVQVTPVVNESHATVKVEGADVASGSASQNIDLVAGSRKDIPILVTAQDGNTKTYIVAVTRAEAAPVATNSSANISANSADNSVPLTLSGGAATSVSIVTSPAHGNAVITGTTIKYTPVAGFSGSDSFTYTASNSGGTSAPATVTINVSPPALLFTPSAGNLTAGTAGSLWSQSLTVNGGTAPYIWSASSLPQGLSLNTTTGVISGTPAVAGNYVFQIDATDAHGATGSVSYNLTVNDAAPVAGNVSLVVSANGSAPVPLDLTGGAATAVNIHSLPSHGTAAVSGTLITYTPTAGYSGPDSFTYTASNSTGTSAPATVTISVNPLLLTVTPATGALPTATAGAAWSQRLSVAGGTAPYTWRASALPAGLLLDADTGLISGIPLTPGNYTLQVTATDSNGATGTANYSLRVNDAAPVAEDVATTITAGATDYVIPLAIKGTATSVAIVTPPAHGTAVVSGLRILYTPVSGYAGQDSFTYSVTGVSGTSLPATVSLNVASSDITLLPADGQLPPGVPGQSYAQTFTASGGTLPYRWQLSGSLPAGLSFTDGQITGVPDTAGSASFTVTVTDKAGNTKHASYTLLINGTAPAGADYSASVDPGKSVTINLTENATGGPFTGASLLTQPDKAQGTAAVESSGGHYRMTFTADPHASGTVVLRYVLNSASGQSQPANITLTIAGRPDPSKDADVIGIASAQHQASQNFARAQIRNFSDRLEKLHGAASLPSDLSGIRFMMPYSRPERTAESRMQITQPQQKNMPAQREAAPLAPVLPLPNRQDAARLSYWTGGYVDFGNSNADGVRFSHTTVGITTGVDYRFTESFTGGIGIGFGRDVSDIGDNGSRNNGQAFSTALYGSFHPDAWFIDGMMGFSRLSFDSKRAVSDASVMARGSRSGHQAFGALISGYEFRTPDSLLSPYTRLQYYRTWLAGYAETGAGESSLAFAPQSFSQLETSVGLRGEHRLAFNWGIASLQGRLEYSQMLNKGNAARVGYAGVSDDTWLLPRYEQGRETIALGTGVDFLLADNVTPGIAYQGTLGLDDSRTRDQMVMMRINIGF